MRTTWAIKLLRDICQNVQYGYTASATGKTIGPKFLRITDIVPETIDWSSVPYCKIESKKKDKYLLRKGDILIARTGATTGYAKYIKATPESIFASYLVRLQLIDSVDSRYVGYIVESDTYKKFIQKNWGGAAQPNANAQILTSFYVPLPPLPIQRKIATVLSAYDDLIENNRRRIKILEEMAQSLYREWFVKFRFPGHQNAPLVDSPLGRIPKGWEVVKLGDYLNALESGKRPKGGIKDGQSGIPSVGAENVLGIGRHNFQSEKYVPRDFFEGMRKGIVEDGDVALYKDGAYIGRSSYFRDGFPHAEFCVNEHVFLLRTNGKSLTQNYLYLWLQESDSVSVIRATNANAAQPGINQTGVKGLTLILPDENTVQDFDQLVETNLRLIISLAKRNSTLRRTRDLLLPKLISGEVDVSHLAIQINASLVDRNDIRGYDFFHRLSALPFVDKIMLFGSRARGDHHSRSDIDLAIFCANASDEQWLQALDCLREERIDTLRKVDCVRFDQVNAALKEHIMTEGKIVYEQPADRRGRKKKEASG